VNGAVFKTVSETVRAGLGRFDSYTPPPIECGLTDETMYWMELSIDAELVKRSREAELLDEADQILSIVISSVKTAKRPKTNPQSAIRNQKSYA
jgi:hypothetical protein